MSLEHPDNPIETVAHEVRQTTRNLMINLKTTLRRIRTLVRYRVAEVRTELGEGDFEVLVEMYGKLSELIDEVNGNPPPAFPEEGEEPPEGW